VARTHYLYSRSGQVGHFRKRVEVTAFLCHRYRMEKRTVSQMIRDVLKALPAETPEDRRMASGLQLVLKALRISSR
jgi:hypothetical protein